MPERGTVAETKGETRWKGLSSQWITWSLIWALASFLSCMYRKDDDPIHLVMAKGQEASVKALCQWKVLMSMEACTHLTKSFVLNKMARSPMCDRCIAYETQTFLRESSRILHPCALIWTCNFLVGLYRAHKWMLGIFLSHSPLYNLFWDRISYWTLMSWLVQLVNECQLSSCLCLTNTTIPGEDHHSWFPYKAPEDLNSGP